MRFLLTLALSLLLAFPAQAGVDLDDTDDWVDVTTNVEPASQIVIHVKFKKDDTNNDPIFVHWQWNSGSPYGYNLGTRTSLGLQFFAGDSTANNPCIEAAAYTTGTVVDWIFTNDGGTCDLFRDGADQSMSDSSTETTMNYTHGSMSGSQIGKDGTAYFNGHIYLIEVWGGTTLTTAEKEFIYNSNLKKAGLQVQPDKLLLACYFDACPEGESCDGITVQDESGNDNSCVIDDGAGNTGALGAFFQDLSYQ